MRGNADRYQRVNAGIVMIEASCKPFAFVDRQIELEFVAGARRRIRPDGVTAVIELPPAGTLTGLAKRALSQTTTEHGVELLALKTPDQLDTARQLIKTHLTEEHA